MVTEWIKNRKGARRIEDIPKEVMVLLNEGKISTVNLTEWLAIDQVELINNIFPIIGLKDCIDDIKKVIGQSKKTSTMGSIKIIGHCLFDYCNQSNNYTEIFGVLKNHHVDTIRCYACYLIALKTQMKISDRLEESKDLVGDKHFGVREIIWMALRSEIENHLTESIEKLKTWTNDSDENIRRFTTESTRPRGVWCKHLEKLKAEPHLAISLLEPLKSDKSIYVQNSVGNWLNDASKSRPQFVIELCEKWSIESKTIETTKIIRRALRTLTKRTGYI